MKKPHKFDENEMKMPPGNWQFHHGGLLVTPTLVPHNGHQLSRLWLQPWLRIWPRSPCQRSAIMRLFIRSQSSSSCHIPMKRDKRKYSENMAYISLYSHIYIYIYIYVCIWMFLAKSYAFLHMNYRCRHNILCMIDRSFGVWSMYDPCLMFICNLSHHQMVSINLYFHLSFMVFQT